MNKIDCVLFNDESRLRDLTKCFTVVNEIHVFDLFSLAGKIIIIVKQGEGSIQTADKNDVMSRLLELGGRAPFFSGHRGSYILLGYRLQRGESVPWITQVAKVEAGGASHLKKTVTLKCELKL